MSDATSIYGSYETREALTREVQLAVMAIVKGKGEPSSREIAELVTELIIIPLIMEFHE
jgi:TolB-like protein